MVSLTFNTAIISFHDTLRLMMVHHQTKLWMQKDFMGQKHMQKDPSVRRYSKKKKKRSYFHQFDYTSLHCDLDPEEDG